MAVIGLGRTFRSLSTKNFRLYFIGQVISNSGTWMQSIAQALLVLRLTGSGVDLGFVLALQFLPLLLFGPSSGLLADRFDRRRLLIATQSLFAIQAFALGTLTLSNSVNLGAVYALASFMGMVNAIDNPTRQSFIEQMVGKDRLQNAVSLNSVVINASRVVGPALGGLLIEMVGIGYCFIVNGLSFAAVLVALLSMEKSGLFPQRKAERSKGQIRAGLAYVRATNELRVTLVAVLIVGTIAFNFQVVLPLFARDTFHGGAGSLGALTAFMGLGSVLGGLVAASAPKTSLRRLSFASLAFGLLTFVVALMPTLDLAYVAMIPMGAASITFISYANINLQLNSKGVMRGRVMALYAMAFLGTTPIGAPIMGWVSQNYGARYALAMGGSSALVSAVLLYFGGRTRA